MVHVELEWKQMHPPWLVSVILYGKSGWWLESCEDQIRRKMRGIKRREKTSVSV